MDKERRGDVWIGEQILSQVRDGSFRFYGDELFVMCPGCGDHHDHFSLSLKKKLAHCFKCNTNASLLSWSTKNPEKWAELVVMLKYLPKNEEESEPAKIDQKGWVFLTKGVDVNTPMENLTQATVEKSLRYCLERGLSYGQIERYQVGTVLFSNRVYFPYWNTSGEVVFWMSRLIEKISGEPKTFNSPGVSRPLFGRHVHRWTNGVILVEGVFDQFATSRSYAVMGSSITKLQSNALKRDGVKRVYVVFDADADEKAMAEAKKLRGEGFKAFPVSMQRLGGDPAEVGKKIMTPLVKELFEFKGNRLELITA